MSPKQSGNNSISTTISSQFKAFKESNTTNLRKNLRWDYEELELTELPKKSQSPKVENLSNRLPLASLFEMSDNSDKED